MLDPQHPSSTPVSRPHLLLAYPVTTTDTLTLPTPPPTSHTPLSVERAGSKEIFQALWKVLHVAGVWEGPLTPPGWTGS